MKKVVLTAIFLLAEALLCNFGDFAVETAEAAEMLYIRDDVSGGDCGEVGTWNATNKTCTLAYDLIDFQLYVASNGITLDGAGHEMTLTELPAQWYNDGVTIDSVTGVTVKNLIFRDFHYGVCCPLREREHGDEYHRHEQRSREHLPLACK